MTEEVLDRSIQLTLEGMLASGYITENESALTTTPIPWIGKTCADCPFFVPGSQFSPRGTCNLWRTSLPPDSDTCAYFDENNREAAAQLIEARSKMTLPQWDNWMKMRSIPVDAEMLP